ncbi:MAG TPA: hypothetical protein VGO62_09450 [Myxococcota bacterium]|jgi:hypothetical protein
MALRSVYICALALAALATITGCAELAADCAGVVLQTTGQICVDAICGDDHSDVVDPQLERPAPDEVPAPAWEPGEGSCNIESDKSGVTIACPDGTRAVFASDDDGHELIERADAASEGGCSDGSVVRQGVDGDGDGKLSPTELTGRTIDCPDRDGVRAPTLSGHMAIYGARDVARLSGRRALTGGLVIKSHALLRLELPQLQSIGGTLRAEDAPLVQSLSFTHLAAVAGDVVVARMPALVRVTVPQLRRVGGSVVVTDNARLSESDVEGIVFRLSRHGFAGPVDVAGNAAP